MCRTCSQVQTLHLPFYFSSLKWREYILDRSLLMETQLGCATLFCELKPLCHQYLLIIYRDRPGKQVQTLHSQFGFLISKDGRFHPGSITFHGVRAGTHGLFYKLRGKVELFNITFREKLLTNLIYTFNTNTTGEKQRIIQVYCKHKLCPRFHT